MGLLDDAIREHLDLKRRRGADPTEIERAEREALGPVRRGPRGHRGRRTASRARLGAGRGDYAATGRALGPLRGRCRGSRGRAAARGLRGAPSVRTRRACCPPGAGRRRWSVRPRGRACSPAASRRRRARARAGTRAQPRAPSGRSSAAHHPRAPRPGDGGVRARASRRRRGRRRAREHPGVPPGRAGPRPSLVRAAPAARFDFDG